MLGYRSETMRQKQEKSIRMGTGQGGEGDVKHTATRKEKSNERDREKERVLERSKEHRDKERKE